MCGIAGILTTSSDGVSGATLDRMKDALQHRGPDDRGTYICGDRQAGLAHTRLAILDLSSTGHQPMSEGDGRYWITFNGEIYNFRQLRSRLEGEGEIFHSQTDTEVILKLYRREGANCLQYLRGMFAFAIWDDLEKSCFLARDPLGIKPLYYWQSGSTLAFASEVKALLASGLPSLNLSAAGLYGYLVSGSVPQPHTLIENIYSLEAGHYLQWKSGHSSNNRYWQLQFGSQQLSLSEAAAKTRSALIDSIEHHFVSDVPVGVFLSGGIDSTAVVALARQTQSGCLRTYSIAFEETEWNEGEIARQVADTFETEHTEFKIDAALGRELLPKFLQAIDQPSIDGFNTFCVSHIARQDGTKVTLSGLGGDELFAGYPSFQQVPQMVQWGQKMGALGGLRSLVGSGLERWGKSAKLRRLGDFLRKEPTATRAYRSFRGIFSHREAIAISRQYLPDLPATIDLPDPLSDTAISVEDEIAYLELNLYIRNQLLRDSDVTSMASGLELRVPLVDRVLLEAIAPISSSARLLPGKQLLVNAVPELPEWVVNRPKRGFAFPFEKWLSTDWQDLFSTSRLPSDIPLIPWSRRWSLGILQHWWESISQ